MVIPGYWFRMVWHPSVSSVECRVSCISAFRRTSFCSARFVRGAYLMVNNTIRYTWSSSDCLMATPCAAHPSSWASLTPYTSLPITGINGMKTQVRYCVVKWQGKKEEEQNNNSKHHNTINNSKKTNTQIHSTPASINHNTYSSSKHRPPNYIASAKHQPPTTSSTQQRSEGGFFSGQGWPWGIVLQPQRALSAVREKGRRNRVFAGVRGDGARKKSWGAWFDGWLARGSRGRSIPQTTAEEGIRAMFQYELIQAEFYKFIKCCMSTPFLRYTCWNFARTCSVSPCWPVNERLSFSAR